MEKISTTTPSKPRSADPKALQKQVRRRGRPETRDLISSFVFAIPFAAVAAVNLKNAVAICWAFLIILLPTAVLRFLLREKLETPRWLAIPVCTLVALMLASLSYYLIRFVSVEITDALGIYLYLPAAYPVLAAASSEQGIRSMGTALGWAVRYLFRFSALILTMGLLREVLAYGQIWGIPLGYGFRVEGAKMTFFGLILMGVLLALLNQARSWNAARRRRTAASKEITTTT